MNKCAHLAAVAPSDNLGEIVAPSAVLVMLVVEEGTRVVFDKEPITTSWRDGNEFIRPKWGIYRQSEHALIEPGDLNDAQVDFADFCITRPA